MAYIAKEPDLEMLIKVTVGSETDPKTVRKMVDQAIAEYHARMGAIRSLRHASAAVAALSISRDPS